MTEKMLDYNTYDSISLVLKKEALENMLSYYAELGWSEYERHEDSRYFDLIHVKLVRPHKIANKDKLQLLQVKLEAAVNRLGQDRRHKHSRSVIFGLTALVISLLFLGFGVPFVIFFDEIWQLSVGICSIVLGLLIPALLIRPFLSMIDKERDEFGKRYKKTSAEIVRIIECARRQRRGEE